MECKLKRFLTSSTIGISLIEVIVVILLLSISFGVFLQGLNSSKIVRTHAEFRMIQATILNDIQQKIRARRFDENISSQWSTTLGPDVASHQLTFDGSNDQVLLGDINALDGISMVTISFWFNRTQDLPANSNHNVSNIMFAKASDPENDNIEIGTDGTNIEIYIDSQYNDGPALTYNAGIQNNTWYHLALTYNKNETYEGKLHINGSEVNSWNQWGGNFDNAGGSPVTIGNSNHIETPFNGIIKEVAVWNEALTATEIATIHNSGSGFNAAVNSGNYSSASGLLGYWKINEGTGTTANDGSGYNNPGTLLNGPIWNSSGVNENSIALWDDIDDFNNYSLSSVPEYPNFSCFVTVNYVDASTNFHTYTSSITNYKSVMVKIEHPSISALIDTMIISPGF
tara:strand:- start:3716 stop:4912 length:1197 start_codon:yes stop_codon:yes gene_type:complete